MNQIEEPEEIEYQMAGSTLSWTTFANGTTSVPITSTASSTSPDISSLLALSPPSLTTPINPAVFPPVLITVTPFTSKPFSSYSSTPTLSLESSPGLPIAAISSSSGSSFFTEASVSSSRSTLTATLSSPLPTNTATSAPVSNIPASQLTSETTPSSPPGTLGLGVTTNIVPPDSTASVTIPNTSASQITSDPSPSQTAFSSGTQPIPFDTPSQTSSITIINPSIPSANPTNPATPPPTSKTQQPPLLVILAIVISTVIFLLLATIIIRKIAVHKRRRRRREFFQVETAQDITAPPRGGSTHSVYQSMSRGGVVSVVTGGEEWRWSRDHVARPMAMWEEDRTDARWGMERGDSTSNMRLGIMGGGVRGYHDVDRDGIGTAL
ncbi:hypothetical protein F5B22DRAFT_202733 [Xylaria bambusicola]|uniref:uncharacterized protein n=1 Tax=Xylaria bambusicola TaxID=326684 RepID=UPI002007DBC1|nr:uncharacterized protein F5B22DRAFT_202733 [Xylaria bambusicola]KAI0515114.1 hypothetical protein F5B22DRAFT_202733 [Xylaria bambusicola]